jgi:hypothetical protein
MSANDQKGKIATRRSQVSLVNGSGTQINPATEEKQDDIIAISESLATKEKQVENEDTLNEILSVLRSVAHAKGIAADIRVTLLSGTVTTVTGVTNIGGQPAVQLIPSNQNQVAILSNIQNII